jgi:azurin
MSAPSSSAAESPFWSFFNAFVGIGLAGFVFLWGMAFLKESKRLNLPKTPTAGVQEVGSDTSSSSSAIPALAAAPAVATPAVAAALPVLEVTIKPDPANPLAYDVKQFVVKAGQPVKLTFNNTHPVQQMHNLIISKPGSMDRIIGKAMELAASPDAMAKGYTPESVDILFKTKLLQNNTSETLEFAAPQESGSYPFFCTFPGHAAIMRGVMKVE